MNTEYNLVDKDESKNTLGINDRKRRHEDRTFRVDANRRDENDEIIKTELEKLAPIQITHKAPSYNTPTPRTPDVSKTVVIINTDNDVKDYEEDKSNATNEKYNQAVNKTTKCKQLSSAYKDPDIALNRIAKSVNSDEDEWSEPTVKFPFPPMTRKRYTFRRRIKTTTPNWKFMDQQQTILPGN